MQFRTAVPSPAQAKLETPTSGSFHNEFSQSLLIFVFLLSIALCARVVWKRRELSIPHVKSSKDSIHIHCEDPSPHTDACLLAPFTMNSTCS